MKSRPVAQRQLVGAPTVAVGATKLNHLDGIARVCVDTCCRRAVEQRDGGGCSFDHLVGKREQPIRDVEAERLCGLEVDDKLEFIRSLQR